MGKPTGFMEYKRLNKSEIRIQDLSLRNFETEELITDEVKY